MVFVITGLAIEGDVLFVSIKFLYSYKHIIFSLDISNPEDTDEDGYGLGYMIGNMTSPGGTQYGMYGGYYGGYGGSDRSGWFRGLYAENHGDPVNPV